MAGVESKNLDSPDEVRTPEKFKSAADYAKV
jgi:hypothetical protein